MNEPSNEMSWIEIGSFVIAALAGAVLGVLAAIWIGGALAAQSPVFWFVSRASAIVAFLLLWLATAWGMTLTSKGLGGRVSGPLAYAMHNVTSWLALGFAAVHAASLLGDRVVPFTVPGLSVPFLSSYQPVLTGLGILSLYLGVIVTGAFYLKKRLGRRAWRTIHGLSYAMFVTVTVHGIALGTDTSTPVMKAIYVIAGLSVALLTLFRLVTVRGGKSPATAARRAAGHPVG
jgi:predicted ferric reductase